MTFKTGLVGNALADYARSIYGAAERRAFTLGASDIGQCSRKVFFAKRGGSRDPG
jgi:hypothetical protein